MNGFLGTGASFAADLTLLVQIAMGTALLVGMALARRRRFREHKYCQSSVLALNLVMIVLVMSPAFRRQVGPQIPGGLRDPYYSMAGLHALLGTMAELLGLYIVLVAATNLLPPALRFRRYKPWMRTELALWWMVILLGIGTYFLWYRAPAAGALGRSDGERGARASVVLTNFVFTPKELTVPVGTTVEWTDDTGRHAVEADDGSFKSAMLVAGDRFERRFDQPGVFPYHCSFHGGTDGKAMAGVITVTPRRD